MKIIQESQLAGVDPSSGVQGEAESGEREALSFWRGCLLGACVLLVTIGSGVGRVSASEPAAGSQVAWQDVVPHAASFQVHADGRRRTCSPSQRVRFHGEHATGHERSPIAQIRTAAGRLRQMARPDLTDIRRAGIRADPMVPVVQ